MTGTCSTPDTVPIGRTALFATRETPDAAVAVAGQERADTGVARVAPALAAFLCRKPRPAKMFRERRIEQVAGHASREGRWGWDGASLESVSGIAHDPIGYAAGDANLYRYCANSPLDCVDPSGTVVIVIHGVESDGTWTSDIEKGLNQYWAANKLQQQDVLRFTWGPNGKNPSWSEASDAVAGLGTEGTKARDRLKALVSDLRKLFDKYGCKDEPINVIAHSQGTIITLGALASGAKLNNFVALGSPLDAEHGVIDVSNAGPNVGQIYNYWSSHDGWAGLKGGGQVWNQSYSTGGWIRDKKTWTLPNNVMQIDVSADVGSHTAFQTEALASQHYGANTGTASRCCDRNNPNFKKEYDAIIKNRLQRP